MALLFAAARLHEDEWRRIPFERRVALIRRRYSLGEAPNVSQRQWFWPESGLGVFVAWQELSGQRFAHASRKGTAHHFLTHSPYGWSAVVPGTPWEILPSVLARHLNDHPSEILRLNPPLGVLTVEEASQRIVFRNDVLGLGKTFILKSNAGTAIASRPIAAHLLSAVAPEPSDLGWAAEQIYGWMLGSLTPFRNLARLLGGSTVVVDASGVIETRKTLAPLLFTEPQNASAISAFERFGEELRLFVASPSIDVALSGGRDSRASAAFATRFFPGMARLRTNEPPALEGIIARQLVERLPYFGSFNADRTAARDAGGRTIWKANTPRIVEAEIHNRALAWARIGEGVLASASLYGQPPLAQPFALTDTFFPSVSGVAGECAKAYYWSPRMVSGAFARSLHAFCEDIRTPIAERLRTHPLTQQSVYPIIRAEFREPLSSILLDSQREASDHGILGYRFLDYWWFTNRMGAGTTIAFSNSDTIAPFLTPEFVAEGLQGAPQVRARAGLLHQLVLAFQPAWNEIPYFDEAQSKVPADQLRYYRPQSLLWEGGLREGFLEILRDSPAFDAPYDRAATVALFENPTIEAHMRAGLNLKALGLAHRHAFWKLCRSVGEDIAEA